MNDWFLLLSMCFEGGPSAASDPIGDHSLRGHLRALASERIPGTYSTSTVYIQCNQVHFLNVRIFHGKLVTKI